ncbi:hypothetical protein [Microcella flavibacter]|uniref:hypothetical protein n=1 Tax=Microcella flavibacter TaxID=1804990 RepID=UPI001456411B|nr:hypothetical protein [Microcella flavibacter]
MAQPPDDHEAADRAREHVIAHLFDVELTRLAYARPRSAEDEQRAAAAVRELARRAAARPAPPPEPATEQPARPWIGRRRPRPEPAPRIPTRRRRPARRDASPPGPRRALALTAAGGLLLSTVAALSAAAAPAPEPPPASSLQLLYRDATAAERDLRDRMLAAGLPVTIGPRILAAGAEGDRGERVAAYRHVRAGTADDARNEVCVLLVDVETVGTSSCIARSVFLTEGMRAVLEGPTSRWSVRWGPTGEAEVLVIGGGEDGPSAPDAPPAPL